MDDDTPSIWVLIKDYGTEGLRDPFMAFEDEDAARQATALIEQAGGVSVKLFRVPLWQL